MFVLRWEQTFTERTFVKGRLAMSKQQIKKEAILFFLSVIAMVIYLAWSLKPMSYNEIKIESGDNLLNLAEQYKGTMSTTKWVAIVKQENNIYDDTIVAGKTLLIPDPPKKGQLASDQ